MQKPASNFFMERERKSLEFHFKSWQFEKKMAFNGQKLKTPSSVLDFYLNPGKSRILGRS
jgi:hypothetical protein